MRLTILILTAALFACSHKVMKNENSFQLNFHELRYGICETDELYQQQMPNSPSGHQVISNRFRLIAKTDTIPGEIQQKFGVEYILESNATGSVPIQQVWIFPRTVHDENGKSFDEVRYTIEKPLNEKTYSTYIMEKDFEIVKGKWTLQMWYGGNKIYERNFYVN